MPAINQPKLGELYNTTFFIPSSLISSVIIPQSNVAWTDGQGGVYYVQALTLPMMISTVSGLGTAGYVSSTQLLSTVADLGTAGYISSPQLLSTVADLGSGGYISSTQLLSTVAGLGNAGYLSALTVEGYFVSTTIGLGTANYVSSTQLASTVVALQNIFVSTTQLTSTIADLGSAGYVSSTQLLSTTFGLGSAGYLSSPHLVSTVQGLGSANYVSTSQLVSTTFGLGSAGYLSSPHLVSTVEGLGSANYVSTSQLVSTTFGLGSANYVSTSQLVSTVYGLGSANYVSTSQLVSTTFGLGSANYVSTSQLQSTVLGLGSALYVSTPQLVSTVFGLGSANYVSTSQLQSTVFGLGSANYVSSTQLISTVASLTDNLVVNNLFVRNVISSSSTFTNFVSTATLLADSVSANSVTVWGSNTLTVDGLSFLSTTVVNGNLTVLGLNNFVSSARVVTNETQTSTVVFRDTELPTALFNLYVNYGELFIDGDKIITNAILGQKLVSTVQNLGSVNYVSSTQLASTLDGLGSANYVSSTQLASTLDGLASANYVSSTQLASTLDGLASANYVSSTQLFSTLDGLGSANYVSTTQLTSTVAGLASANYVSSTQLFSTVFGLGSANYVSSTQLASTVAGLASANYVSSTHLNSTVAGLGSAGYISSQQLTSTFTGLTQGFVTSSINVKSGAFAQSTYSRFISTTYLVGNDITAKKLIPEGAFNIAKSTDGLNWQNPVLNGFLNQGNGVIAGNGIFVAVGDSSNTEGVIKYSYNGINWTNSVNADFTNNNGDHIAYGIAYSPSLNRYVAGGHGTSGRTSLLYSSDAVTWSNPTNGFSMPVYGITWASGLGGAGLFIAVGDGNGIQTRSVQYSTDGIFWSQANSGGFSNNVGNITVGYNVAYDGLNRLWAVGYGNSNRQMITSVNGSNWAVRSGGLGDYFSDDGAYGIVFSPSLSRWVAVGVTFNTNVETTILISADAAGSTWNYANAGSGFSGGAGYAVIWDSPNQQFVATGAGSYDGGVFQFSTDGHTWTTNGATPFEYYGSYTGTALTLSNGRYIATGYGQTLTPGVLATTINPSSISTTTLTAKTIIAETVRVTGLNTLIVNGNSYFDGPTQFSTSISVNDSLTAGSMNLNGNLLTVGNINLLSNSSWVRAPVLSTLNLNTSTVTFADTLRNGSNSRVYVTSNQLYFNNNPVLVGDGIAGANLVLNNLTVLSSLSAAYTYTNTISTTNVFARYISTKNIYTSTISLGDTQFPWVVHKLYASSSMLYFDSINLTSSIVGNGCGTCIDSNIGFSNVLVNGTLSSMSTYTHYISAANIEVDTITSLDTAASSFTLFDNVLGQSYNLYTQAGILYFGTSSIGATPDVVNSNLVLTTLRVTDATSTNTLNVKSISSGQAAMSTLNLVDGITGTLQPLYTNNGVLYFSTNQVLPFGPNMMFSTIWVRDAISTASTFANYISAPTLITSTVRANNIQVARISSLEVQTSSLRFTDTTAGGVTAPLVNSNGNLLFNNMAIGLGGRNSFAPQFSTLRVLQTISTGSTFTNYVSASQMLTSSLLAQSVRTNVISTASLVTSSFTFTTMTGNSANLNSVYSGSTFTNFLSTGILNAFQVQNTSSLTFVDSVTGNPNYLYTRSGVLYINNTPGFGTLTIDSNFNLSNLNVLDTISTSSTFASYISVAELQVSTISANQLFVDTNIVTSSLNVIEINTNKINTRPYPILNFGSNTTQCCGVGTGFADCAFTYPYNQTPYVTVTGRDLQNDLAVFNIVYTDTYGFTVGSYNINTGALVSSINFNWTAMGY